MLAVPTFLLMKSHARSLRVLRPNVLAAVVTVSRTSPNWKMNVTSGLSIFLASADSLLKFDVFYETNCFQIVLAILYSCG
jgi:hypothetical protein